MIAVQTTIGLQVLTAADAARWLRVDEAQAVPGVWIALDHDTPPFSSLHCIDIEGDEDEESAASAVGRRVIEITRAVAASGGEVRS